jgi:integrase
VTPVHVLDVLNAALKKNGPSVAAEAKRTMSAVFELAVSTLRAETDPVYPVRKALPANKTQHKRPLSIEEIGQLLRALDGYDRNFQTVAALRLMWLTLCRPNEVVGAQWKELDLDATVWRIPAERMKKRKEHVVPLPRQAVEVLRAMHGFTGTHAHVFPHRDDRTKPMTDATLRQALNYLGWGGKYSPHATRTTGSTRLNEMGFSSDWIERQLAHTEPNAVRRTYNHADYFADRATLMQHWADMLDVWKVGAKVLPLRATSAPK